MANCCSNCDLVAVCSMMPEAVRHLGILDRKAGCYYSIVLSYQAGYESRHSEVITEFEKFATAVPYSSYYSASEARGAKVESIAVIQLGGLIIESCLDCLDLVVLDRKSELDRGFSFAMILNVNSYLSIDECHLDSRLLVDFCQRRMKVIVMDSHHSVSASVFPRGLEIPYLFLKGYAVCSLHINNLSNLEFKRTLVSKCLIA